MSEKSHTPLSISTVHCESYEEENIIVKKTKNVIFPYEIMYKYDDVKTNHRLVFTTDFIRISEITKDGTIILKSCLLKSILKKINNTIFKMDGIRVYPKCVNSDKFKGKTNVELKIGKGNVSFFHLSSTKGNKIVKKYISGQDFRKNFLIHYPYFKNYTRVDNVGTIDGKFVIRPVIWTFFDKKNNTTQNLIHYTVIESEFKYQLKMTKSIIDTKSHVHLDDITL